MLKKKLLLALAVLLPSYSYSESIAPYYGYTGNAVADQALRWSMENVLPDPPGLEIQNVIYTYKILKETDDHVTVHVQNELANGNGYIFRETDEWEPGSLSGTQINKVVAVGSIHRSLWGDGSIDIEGDGQIFDTSVVYTYRVDPCYDPQFDPNCPGYELQVPDIYDGSDIEIYDALANGDARQTQWRPDDDYFDDDEEELSEEERAKLEEEEEKDSEERLEKALAAADNSALFAEALAMSQMADTMNMAVNMNSYYNASIQGGTYVETITLQDKQLPENERGLRNGLAQQLLHQKMIEMQYK